MAGETQRMIGGGGNIHCACGCGRIIREAWACSHADHGEGSPRNDELFASKACLEKHQRYEHGLSDAELVSNRNKTAAN
jgi:hypothetical protein